MTHAIYGGVARSNQSTVNSPSDIPSYSEMVKVRPSEDQAIVLDISSDYPNRKYTDALLEHIKPTEIKYMSRISGAWFCLFLSDVDVAKKLVEEIKTLRVENRDVLISLLVKKSKKVIISNVSPVLSNTAIKRFLATTVGVRVTSSVAELRANTGGDERIVGVASFRRQVFIHPEDIPKFSRSNQFDVNVKKHFVFFTTDKPVCFRCQAAGHFAEDCQQESKEEDEKVPPSTVEQKKPDGVASEAATNQLSGNTAVLAPSSAPGAEYRATATSNASTVSTQDANKTCKSPLTTSLLSTLHLHLTKSTKSLFQ